METESIIMKPEEQSLFLQKISDFAKSLNDEAADDLNKAFLILASERIDSTTMNAVCSIGASDEQLVDIISHSMSEISKLKNACILAVAKESSDD